MKSDRNSNKSITLVLIAQLFLLGGCVSGVPSTGSTSPASSPPLSATDKNCAAALQKGLLKYKGKADPPDAAQVTFLSILPKIKEISVDLKSYINYKECKNAENIKLKEVIAQVKTLSDFLMIIEQINQENPKLDREKEDSIKKKVANTRIIPNYTNNESETILSRQSLQYTEDEMREITNQVELLVPPNNTDDLKKQIRDLTEKLTAAEKENSSLRQDLSNQKNLFILALLILLPTAGVGGYFLAKRSTLTTKRKTPASNPRPADKIASQDINSGRKGRKGLGSDEAKSSSPAQSYSDAQNESRDPNFKLRDKPKVETDGLDHGFEGIEASPSNQPQRRYTSISQNPSTSRPDANPQKAYVNQALTYDLAVGYYNHGSYEFLQSSSQGYYSATAESMMRNRQFWENPLELIEAHNGLFWIVQTTEPYFLLLPNPSKRITETRLPGLEYFFETNFKNENYQSCVVVSPAYMNYENGKWTMQQKGQISFAN
jgi:hypothetical protein